MTATTIDACSKKPSLAALAAATPESRDRYVDFLRALSIAVVVLGHWLMAIVYVHDGSLSGASALDVIPGMWLLTWVLQVMPLFFFVGGFANLVTIDSDRRKGLGYRAFVLARMQRLLRPTAIFIGVWMVIAVALEAGLGSGNAGLSAATGLIAKPLWFLGVYVLVIALAPPMLALHRRYGVGVPVAMVICAALVDVGRLVYEIPNIGFLNFAFVWLLPHQLGFLYADGTLAAWGRKVHGAMAAGGIAALVVLTNVGIYAPSLVGAKSRLASNNSPPSVCLIALTVWLVGAAMLLRPRLSLWLRGRRPWTAVIAANSVIMTVFLWHLTALLVAVATLYPLGFPQPVGGSAAWWALRPLWIAILVACLAVFVAVFGRFERGPAAAVLRPLRPRGPVPVILTALGIAGLVVGLSGFAIAGFAGILQPDAQPLAFLDVTPVSSAAYLAAGALCLSIGARRIRGGQSGM